MAQSELSLPDAAATEAAGAALAAAWVSTDYAVRLITLEGELGAGKTTLVRGFLRRLGVTDRVRSPSYTVLEPYEVNGVEVYHLDLYRLGSHEELELIGYRDLDEPRGLLIAEWAERIPELLARSELHIVLRYAGEGRALAATARSEAARPLRRHWLGSLRDSSA